MSVAAQSCRSSPAGMSNSFFQRGGLWVCRAWSSSRAIWPVTFSAPPAQSDVMMKRELIVRMFAGTVILTSLALAHYHNPNWLWVTAFVGFNLLQSSITKFCPLEMVSKNLAWAVPAAHS